MNPVLFVGSQPYDVAPLLDIARFGRDEAGMDAIFASVAPPETRDGVHTLVRSAGFETTDTVQVVPPRRSRNPSHRARRWRDANRAVMDRALSEIRPVAVLSTVNPRPGHIVDGVARRGIPALLLQLWFWGDRAFQQTWDVGDRRVRQADWPMRPRVREWVNRRAEAMHGVPQHIVWNVRAGTVAVEGPAMRRQLVADGVAADRVVATGNPVLDDLHRLRDDAGDASARVRDALGIPADRPIVSHFRNHEDRMLTLDPGTREGAQEQIIGAARQGAPSAAVVVKIHPREGKAERELIRSLDPDVIVAGSEIDTVELIAASAVTIGTFSTTLLQSVALDRPTVSAVLWPGLEYWERATDWSGVHRVRTAADLREALRRQFDDEAYRTTWARRRNEFCREHFLLDGRGSERIVELLQRRIGDRARSTGCA